MAETNAMTLFIDNARDNVTNAFETIDYSHHEIHSGSHYFVSGFEELTSTEAKEFYLKTPDSTKWAHLTFSISATGKFEWYIQEDASTRTGGTTIEAVNNNRNSTKISTVLIVEDGTSTSTGTIIESAGGGTTAAGGFFASTPAAGGNTDRENEIILKQNTGYIFRFVSNADNNIYSYKGSWYEHSNRV